MANTKNSINTDYGKVSVIMPNYNGEKFLKETIDSVLSQTYQNLELIFIDDCSTDGSLEIVKSIKDDRLIILSTEENGGAAKARNKGIDYATGKWLAFLDSDDLWTSDKLSRQLSFMVEKDVAFSFTHYDVINELGEKQTEFRPKKTEYTYKQILKHNSIGCLTVVVDVEKVGKVYMPEEAVKREDFAAWISVLEKGEKAYCLDQTLAKYRLHANSVSSKKVKMIKYQWRVLRKVFKFNPFKAVFYLVCWAVSGVFKYR